MKIDLYVIVSNKTAVRSKKLEGVLAAIAKDNDVVTKSIVEHEAESISPEMIKDNVQLERINNPLYDSQLKSLTTKNISNSLKHLEALKLIATNTREGAYPIVLEDDPLLSDTFDDDFDGIFKNLVSKSWDVVMLGIPASQPGFEPMSSSFKILPVCNAYMIKPPAASKLSNSFLPIRYPTNIHLSFTMDAFGIVPLVYKPQLFIDGSKYGIFVSTLTPNNELSFNADYVKAKRLIGESKHQEAIDVITSTPLSSHPDFLHLKALCEMEVSGIDDAEKTFDEAMKVYESNGATLNNGSTFLKDYINIYRPR